MLFLIQLQSFDATSVNYTASFPVHPGMGRLYSVVVSVDNETSSQSSGQAAYVPTSSYDCAYVDTSKENDGQICRLRCVHLKRPSLASTCFLLSCAVPSQ